MTYILAYDIGTTGVKTCLFGVEKTIKLIASASAEYPLYIVDGGGAGYMEETGDTYIQRRGLNRVIDVQQVDALLFYKTPVEDGKQPTEDNFYVVPIQ